MLKIERILCPMDFSEFSVRAFGYAQSLAKRYSAKLYVEHVVQPLGTAYPYYVFPETVNQIYGDLADEAKQHLQEFVKIHTRDGTQAEFVVETGPVSQCILSFSETQAIDLIVMGTHGRQGMDHLTMGSVTEKVLRKARCPVLAVRRPAHDFVSPEKEEEPVRLQKILFCTDFSQQSERALSYAISLGMEYNAELTLLHVLENVPKSDDLEKETERIRQQLWKPVPPDARNWSTIKSVVRIGKPYQEIIQLALEAHIDLVIMGVRGRSALDLALFGSTTHRVLQLGPCPVLAVRV
jgi:nucleotide-binding universal stress UspA family protein